MEQQLPPEAIIAFRLGEALLPAQRELYRLFDGDLAMMLVFGELAQYSALKRFKSANKSLPYQHCNAHSIALASGIPRETVRRKLDKLVKRGWILQQANGDFCLIENRDPPLHNNFEEFNRLLLTDMRAAIKDLAGIEFPDKDQSS